MKSKKFISLITLLFLIFSVSLVFAQQDKDVTPQKGFDPQKRTLRNFDPATIQTVSGTIESVENIPPERGRIGGIHIQLKTDEGIIPVHLGPQWYIEKQNFKLEKGDKVEIKGSRVKLNDKPTIIAAELKKGKDVLILRDSAGIPQWGGSRRK